MLPVANHFKECDDGYGDEGLLAVLGIKRIRLASGCWALQEVLLQAACMCSSMPGKPVSLLCTLHQTSAGIRASAGE
jgi:hypothetical protein